ncbi:MAG: HlyC/CorC family transporter [Lachnospiraceae bacterium]|nr:HlyC/CorC family transporter [Lachnospiraceae bacterium]
MDSDSCIQLIFIVLLIILSAFFSSAETALTTVNRIKIRNLAEEGDHRAETVLKIIDDSGKMLSAILIGNNIVNLSASALVTAFSMKIWGSWSVSIATGILTLIVLIFGEISPKTMATIEAERMALRYAGIIYVLMKILTPVIFIVNKLSLGILTILRVDRSKARKIMTERELRTIVAVGKDEGLIEDSEYEMIDNVFDFGDSKAKDIMVPRIEMASVNVDASFGEILKIYEENHYTRYPVYEGTPDSIIGFINIKDLILYEDREGFSVRDILREPVYTYENKNTAELLMEMRDSADSYAIVLDDYGVAAGLVTLEDLLEEIVGEIHDEYDEDEPDPIEKVSDNEYVVEGTARLDDINDELGTDLRSEDYDNIAGYLLECLEHLPADGEEYTDKDGVRFCIISMDKNRIEKVSIRLDK